ncbi:MAG TPA: branched-chain amino acid ABC transporter permease [Trueperaceae bacterium]
MRGLRRDSVAREWLIMVIAAAVLLALPWFLVQIGGYRELATRIIIFAIFALGFDLLVGFTGYLSFGHAAFWGVGAYVCGYYMLHFSPNPLIGMLLAVVVVGIIALVLGLITLRRHGIYFAILTLAFAEMFYYAALAPLQQWTGGDNGLTGIPTPDLFGIELQGNAVHLFTCAWALVAIYVALRIRRSPYGLILKAIKANERRLLYTGVDVFRYKVAAFTISGIYGGLAGSLYAIYETYVPTESLRWTTSGEVIIMSVIGGLGTLFGPMIGAGIVLYLENVLSAVTSQWYLILGLIFMAFVIFLPGGVVEAFGRIGRRFGRKRAVGGGPTPAEIRDRPERGVDR